MLPKHNSDVTGPAQTLDEVQTQVCGDGSAGAPPVHRQPAHPHRALVPLEMAVVGEDECWAAFGDDQEIVRHHQIAQAQQPWHTPW